MNASDISYVALDLGFYQVSIPGAASRWLLSGEGRGIPTSNNPLRKCGAERLGQAANELPAKQSIEKAGACPDELALRQWMKAQQAYPARERVGQLRDEQDIRRSSEDESSSRALGSSPANCKFNDRLIARFYVGQLLDLLSADC